MRESGSVKELQRIVGQLVRSSFERTYRLINAKVGGCAVVRRFLGGVCRVGGTEFCRVKREMRFSVQNFLFFACGDLFLLKSSGRASNPWCKIRPVLQFARVLTFQKSLAAGFSFQRTCAVRCEGDYDMLGKRGRVFFLAALVCCNLGGSVRSLKSSLTEARREGQPPKVRKPAGG